MRTKKDDSPKYLDGLHASKSRRSFYIPDDTWYAFQSKLWANRTDATKWLNQRINAYLNEEEHKSDPEP